MKAVHQFLPTFEPGAIGNHAVQVQRTLRENGYESEIFAEYTRGSFVGTSHVHGDYASKVAANDDDVLIYHMAIGSNVADFVRDRPQRLIVDHHNITPVEYYQPWEPGVTYGMAWGRNQLRELASRTTVGIADSEYNRRELEDLRYARSAVVPILLDFHAFDHAVDKIALESRMSQKQDGGSDWLFVGWIAPHKCQHDIILAFSLYKKLFDPNARLHLVGRISAQAYYDACEKLIAELGLQDSVFLHGSVSDGELGAIYKAADVLVSMSEHEGVGIPILEAMHHRLPVVAFAAAAVPETVGDAGVLLTRKKPAVVAAGVHRVLSDQGLADALVARGVERLQEFSLERNQQKLLAALEMTDL